MEDVGDWIVIDTDCGSDDAMALMMALSGKDSSRVLAITCCFGNTSVDNVCRNVMRVLQVCQHTKIPVYRGNSSALTPYSNSRVRVEGAEIHGTDGFGNCGHLFPTGDLQTEDEFASLALLRLARKHPKRITLVALAPLTNLAMAQRLDQEFTGLLKGIVCLGGNYKGIGNTTETAEYNFCCDPEAAHIVLAESRCPVTLVPWETAMEYGIEWDEFDDLIATPTKRGNLLKKVTAVVAMFCRKEGDPMFLDCDVLAVAAALYPESVTASLKRAMAVECKGEYTRGMAICLRDSPDILEKNKIEIVQHFDKNVLNLLRRNMLAD